MHQLQQIRYEMLVLMTLMIRVNTKKKTKISKNIRNNVNLSCVLYSLRSELKIYYIIKIVWKVDSIHATAPFPGGAVNFQDTRVRKSNKHVWKSDFEVS